MAMHEAEPRYTVAVERLLRIVSLAAHETATIDDALKVSLREICVYADWTVGYAMWAAEAEGGGWQPSGIWYGADDQALAAFIDATNQKTAAGERGLSGRAAREGRAVWVENLAQEQDFPRKAAAQAAGLTSAVVIPVSAKGEIKALLEFYSTQRMGPDQQLLAALTQIGLNLGIVLEQKRAEQALRASEERFRALVMNSRDLITLIDGQGKITYQSPSIKRVMGYERHDWQGEQLLEFVHPDDVEHVRKELDEMKEGRAQSKDLELRARHRDGSWRWLDVSATNHLDHPHVGGIVINSLDVTIRKDASQRLLQVARELERSNEELERFAYVASHDLQEPLRMVASYVQLLEDRYSDQLDEDALEFIHFASDGAERMSRLINDLLAFSRLGSRGRPFEAVDLNVPLEQAMRNLERAADEAGADILYDDLPSVHGDEGQLMQVFQNLISNAIKFRRKEVEPRIEIRAERKDEMWRIEIEDNGIGIDPDITDRLFVIFTRLHQREEYEGTGIGLAMTKKIVERHGGTIGVNSTPDKGSMFWFTLPAEPRFDPVVALRIEKASAQKELQ